MHTPSPNLNGRYRGMLRLAMWVVALGLVALGCGADGDVNAAGDPIETNDGNVLVRPPDVLSGNPEPTAVPLADLPPPLEGAKPTPLVDFTYFNGLPGSTGDFAGKPTVLNFWASNCPACIAEMPDFEEVYQARQGEVVFVGVNVADVSREAADRLAEATGVTYPLADDTSSAVFREFGGFVMPTTVFLNAQGQVAYTWSGVLTAGELDKLINDHITPGSI